MSTPHRLETARLTARPISLDDVAQLQALHRAEAVAEHIGGCTGPRRWPSRGRSTAASSSCAARSSTGSAWATASGCSARRRSGRTVGRSGLRHYYLDSRDEIELLYAFEPEVWGRGYGTEAAVAVVDFAFGTLGVESIVSFTLPDNPGSLRVMEKAGLTFEKEMIRLEPPAFLVYRLTREDWEAAR